MLKKVFKYLSYFFAVGTAVLFILILTGIDISPFYALIPLVAALVFQFLSKDNRELPHSAKEWLVTVFSYVFVIGIVCASAVLVVVAS